MFDFLRENPYYLYFALISVISVAVTCYDKSVSKKRGARRVSEAMLLFLSALGGSLAMLATMLFIRHKTKHVKFMLGIPLIIAAQIFIIVFFYLK